MQPESWEDLSAGFAAALLQPGGPVPEGLLDARSQRRFRVYRNNVFASLTNALKARFPAILRLTGEEFFFQSAKLFVQQSPPRSAAMSVYGAGFAQFLADLPAARELPFLADVARLEWALNEALHAADAEPMPADALASLAPEALGGVRLSLHPSLRLLASAYPAFSIWRTNIADAEVEPIAADAPGEHMLVWRDGLKAVACRLAREVHASLLQLAQGASLETAASAAPEAFGEALGLLLQNGLVTGITIQQEAGK